ncbi:MAG: hypothetical protein DRP51_00980 [Candidatus Zixiibacteriota bacterium]|nr:MAG: hypothetical protein DRP51_00980 [candidate division Zixibacteria bacterium]
MIVAFIPVLSSLFEFITGNIIDLVGGLGAIIMITAAWVARKYLVPFLKVESRRRYAAYIAAIADEVTDELRLKYPDKSWAVYLDEAVDKIIRICDISPEVARRAAAASISRR